MALTVSIMRAAVLLGVSRRSVYNYIKRGDLVTIRCGASQRVVAMSLENLARKWAVRGALDKAEP